MDYEKFSVLSALFCSASRSKFEFQPKFPKFPKNTSQIKGALTDNKTV